MRVSLDLAGTVVVAASILSLPARGAESARAVPDALAGSACNNAFFVAPHGDDRSDGTQQNPWRTIRHAAELLAPGKTVYVRAGVYDEEVVVRHSGTPDAYVSLENYPGERPVIDPRFRRQHAIRVLGASYVRIKGFEIRNCRGDLQEPYSMAAIQIEGSGPKLPLRHCVVEQNVVHHIIGIGDAPNKAARGIAVAYADHVTVQNNTVYDVVGHTESMGIKCDEVSHALIRRNLVYLCDKEGVRLITQDTDSENVIEGNIAVHNATGIAVNHCRTSRQTLVRSNFCAWNWNRGINPKHTRNVVLTHNTVVGNQDWGIDIHGNGTVKGDNYSPVVKNNLFSLNHGAWWLYDPEVFDEQVDYNLYHHRRGTILARFNWSNADQCYGLDDIRETTGRRKTVRGPYDQHGKEGDPLLVAPEKGDFRLRPGSPARGAADDCRDMGALESELTEVGADKRYSLACIPDLGELKLAVESFSSEGSAGPAANVVDGSRTTYWELDTAADARREIVLALPGNRVYELAYLTITKYPAEDQYFYRRFALAVDDGSGDWKPVAEPPEHPLTGYRGLANGETWSLPAGTRARRVRLTILSGYGPLVRVPEIRIYGRG